MNLDNIDFTKKENQTLKNWFLLMWGNNYIFLFILGIAFTVAGIYYSDLSESITYVFLSIPILSCIAIAYKGFYQYWNRQKKG